MNKYEHNFGARALGGNDSPKRRLVWGGVAFFLMSTFMAACNCSSDADADETTMGAGDETTLLDGAAGDGAADGAGASSGDGNGFGTTSGEGGEDDGCAAVDFLFIVDNSVSMRDQQAALIASFPSFMQTIESTLETSDYQIMVVDTDDVTRCTPSNCTSGADRAHELCDEMGNYACTTTFGACDNTIGAGVVHPAGDGASNRVCSLVGGNRYIVEGETDLAGTFGCMAQVGLAGHRRERPMDALVAAMAPDINAAGGCNEGFLRDEAILVVTFISDDENVEDAGMPQDWYDAVVTAKGGNEDSVVVLGLIPPGTDTGDCGPERAGRHWSEFIDLWGDRGLEASICSEDYDPFFQSAVAVIDETCEEFEPPR
ncbi:MAG: hypothetical protein AAGA56_01135 [Myxococcota bacterium]